MRLLFAQLDINLIFLSFFLLFKVTLWKYAEKYVFKYHFHGRYMKFHLLPNLLREILIYLKLWELFPREKTLHYCCSALKFQIYEVRKTELQLWAEIIQQNSAHNIFKKMFSTNLLSEFNLSVMLAWKK